MCLSEIFLALTLLFSIFCLKYNKLENHIPQFSAFAVLLVFWDSEIMWECDFFLPVRNVWNSIPIMFAGSVLIYENNLLNQRIMLIIMTLAAVLLMSVRNIFMLVFLVELMIIPTYFLLYEGWNKDTFFRSNYFKYNVLASAFMIFSAAVPLFVNASGNFEDVRFAISLSDVPSRFVMLAALLSIAAFSIRSGLFGTCFDGLDLKKSAPVFCISVPVNILILLRLLPEVFCYADVQFFLRSVFCVSALYYSIAIYNSLKIYDLIRNLAAYNAGITLLCCAVGINLGGAWFSGVLNMLGFFVLFVSVRKRFNCELIDIDDLFSLGSKNRRLAAAVSCMFLCMIAFPPSADFFEKFALISSLIKCNFQLEQFIFFVSFVPIIIKTVRIISGLWFENNSNYFSVVNVKLTNIVYVVAYISMFAEPIMHGISIGGRYVMESQYKK